MYLWTVRLQTRIPSFSSSPRIRSAPHRGFCGHLPDERGSCRRRSTWLASVSARTREGPHGANGGSSPAERASSGGHAGLTRAATPSPGAAMVPIERGRIFRSATISCCLSRAFSATSLRAIEADPRPARARTERSRSCSSGIAFAARRDASARARSCGDASWNLNDGTSAVARPAEADPRRASAGGSTLGFDEHSSGKAPRRRRRGLGGSRPRTRTRGAGRGRASLRSHTRSITSSTRDWMPNFRKIDSS